MIRHSRPALVAMVLALATGGRAEADEPARPNVVILYADDMGPGDIAAWNPDSRIPTPHLDRLTREGTRFTDAHSSSAICSPSRYGLLHGRYHWRKFHGIVDAFGPSCLDADRTTLAEMFRAVGYRTACIGKWHLGWDWDAIRRPRRRSDRVAARVTADAFDWSRPIPGGPLDHGFDTYFGDDVPNFPPYAWFRDDRVLAPPTQHLVVRGKTAEGAWETRPGPAVADWNFHAVMPRLVAEAVAWIDQQEPARPFFLYLPFTAPHTPIVPAAEYVGRSRAGGYGDYVVQTDEAVGRVLEALERRGLAANTLVIFSADNGPEQYAYERVRAHGHRSMGPLRGVKRDLWEGGHRVPLIVRWPGQVPAGRTATGLIGQIDLFATLAGIVGGVIPAGSAEDSLDQRALLMGSGPSARDTLVHNTNPHSYAIRHGDWVLIDAPSGGVSRVPDWYVAAEGWGENPSPGELYDLRVDPGQRTNRYAEEPDRVAALRGRLVEIVGAERLRRPHAGDAGSRSPATSSSGRR